MLFPSLTSRPKFILTLILPIHVSLHHVRLKFSWLVKHSMFGIAFANKDRNLRNLHIHNNKGVNYS